MADLTDADKVLRNDTGKSIATNIASIATALSTSNTLDGLDDVTINSGTLSGNQALVYDAVAGKWVNNGLVVPDELNDLSDVTINTPLNRQELVYNDALEVFQNKTTRVELTMAQYNQLVEDDHVLPNVDYYITDAPSMSGTSKELSYDGGTDSVYDAVETKADKSSFTKKSVSQQNVSVGANTITSLQLTVSDAVLGFIVGFYISGDVVVPIQAYFSSSTEIYFRIKNTGNTDTSCNISVFYI